MATGRKYVPSPEGLDLEFFRRAVATGILHVQRCADCGVCSHPPVHYCPQCFSPNREFIPSGQTGFVYSFTVTRRALEPAWAEETPYVTIVAELDEGPRVIGAGHGFDPSAIDLDQRVRLRVEAKSDDFAFIWIEPDSGNQQQGEERGG